MEAKTALWEILKKAVAGAIENPVATMTSGLPHKDAKMILAPFSPPESN